MTSYALLCNFSLSGHSRAVQASCALLGAAALQIYAWPPPLLPPFRGDHSPTFPGTPIGCGVLAPPVEAGQLGPLATSEGGVPSHQGVPSGEQ